MHPLIRHTGPESNPDFDKFLSAACHGDRDTVKALLAAKVDPNKPINDEDGKFVSYNRTRDALCYAVERDDAEMVQTLLDAKADPNIRRDSPLDFIKLQTLTLRNKGNKVLQLLLNAKANINARLYPYTTLLLRAIFEYKPTAVKALVIAGARIPTPTVWTLLNSSLTPYLSSWDFVKSLADYATGKLFEHNNYIYAYTPEVLTALSEGLRIRKIEPQILPTLAKTVKTANTALPTALTDLITSYADPENHELSPEFVNSVKYRNSKCYLLLEKFNAITGNCLDRCLRKRSQFSKPEMTQKQKLKK